tara:strand:- start:520 stop:1146 length:627 start_codon:yes stop_codon:yes gene_type:complete
MSLINRNETRLLVENWRKVLEEGLYNDDSELLSENIIKNALIALALSAPGFFGAVDDASAKNPNEILNMPGVQSVYDKDSSFDINSLKKVAKTINLTAKLLTAIDMPEEKDKQKIANRIEKVEDHLLEKFNNFVEKESKNTTFTRACDAFISALNEYYIVPTNRKLKRLNINVDSQQTSQRLDDETQRKIDKMAQQILDHQKRENMRK